MQIAVTVTRADTGQSFDVDLPDEIPMGQLLDELTKEMGLPRLGSSGDLAVYEVSSKRTGGTLRDGSLASSGVKAGDVLLLTSSFVAGSGKIEVPEGSDAIAGSCCPFRSAVLVTPKGPAMIDPPCRRACMLFVPGEGGSGQCAITLIALTSKARTA